MTERAGRTGSERHPTLLIPNLGADESAQWPRFSQTPPVARLTQLWRLLFASGNRISGQAPPAEAWPPALGSRPDEAAFEWMDDLAAAAWLNDASAHDLVAQAGLPDLGPAPAVVARVHDKAFAIRSAREMAEEPRSLHGLIHLYDPSDLADADGLIAGIEAVLSRWPDWTGGRFTLKPRLGSSGRGRIGGEPRRLEADPLRSALRGSLSRLAERGGAVLEPWLDRVRDLSVAMHIAREAPPGEPGLTLLGSLEQRVSASGVYLGHLGEIDSRGRVFSGAAEDESMRTAAAALARRARDTGYSGPCGLDGFVFRLADDPDAEAREVLRPIVELNARYTAGVVVVGLIRRALSRVKQRLGLSPGERLAFLFALQCPDTWASWQDAVERLGEGALLLPLAPPLDARGPALLFAPYLDTIRAALGGPIPSGAGSSAVASPRRR